VTIPLTRRFRIEVRPQARLLLELYVVIGLLIGLLELRPDAAWWGLGQVAGTAGAFAGLALVAALVHEGGHAVAAALSGRRVRALVIKLGAGVVIEEAPPGTFGASQLSLVLVAAAGPLASLAVGALFMLLADGTQSAFWWVGLLALADGTLNLLPLGSRADGTRLLAALRG
jgi:hypothetical protein